MLIFLMLISITGCTSEQSDMLKQAVDLAKDAKETIYPVPPNESSELYPDKITLASWNIQIFGRSKAGKPEVMNVIAQTITRYDIVAIQEIRDSSGTAIEMLEALVDSLGVDYDYIISPRLGRSQSKEQYAFMFRTDRVEVLASYTLQDPHDIFHREPFIARFTVRPSMNGNLTFTLINMHTDPEETIHEIKELPSAIYNAQDRFPSEDDFILLGDLNLDCRYYEESDKSPFPTSRYIWVIPDWADTNLAKSSCTYDRIIMTKQATATDWTEQAGVFRFDQYFNLTPKFAKTVSDHYPVWAVFHTNKE